MQHVSRRRGSTFVFVHVRADVSSVMRSSTLSSATYGGALGDYNQSYVNCKKFDYAKRSFMHRL